MNTKGAGMLVVVAILMSGTFVVRSAYLTPSGTSLLAAVTVGNVVEPTVNPATAGTGAPAGGSATPTPSSCTPGPQSADLECPETGDYNCNYPNFDSKGVQCMQGKNCSQSVPSGTGGQTQLKGFCECAHSCKAAIQTADAGSKTQSDASPGPAPSIGSAQPQVTPATAPTVGSGQPQPTATPAPTTGSAQPQVTPATAPTVGSGQPSAPSAGSQISNIANGGIPASSAPTGAGAGAGSAPPPPAISSPPASTLGTTGSYTPSSPSAPTPSSQGYQSAPSSYPFQTQSTFTGQGTGASYQNGNASFLGNYFSPFASLASNFVSSAPASAKNFVQILNTYLAPPPSSSGAGSSQQNVLSRAQEALLRSIGAFQTTLAPLADSVRATLNSGVIAPQHSSPSVTQNLNNIATTQDVATLLGSAEFFSSTPTNPQAQELVSAFLTSSTSPAEQSLISIADFASTTATTTRPAYAADLFATSSATWDASALGVPSDISAIADLSSTLAELNGGWAHGGGSPAEHAAALAQAQTNYAYVSAQIDALKSAQSAQVCDLTCASTLASLESQLPAREDQIEQLEALVQNDATTPAKTPLPAPSLQIEEIVQNALQNAQTSAGATPASAPSLPVDAFNAPIAPRSTSQSLENATSSPSSVSTSSSPVQFYQTPPDLPTVTTQLSVSAGTSTPPAATDIAHIFIDRVVNALRSWLDSL